MLCNCVTSQHSYNQQYFLVVKWQGYDDEIMSVCACVCVVNDLFRMRAFGASLQLDPVCSVFQNDYYLVTFVTVCCAVNPFL